MSQSQKSWSWLNSVIKAFATATALRPEKYFYDILIRHSSCGTVYCRRGFKVSHCEPVPVWLVFPNVIGKYQKVYWHESKQVCHQWCLKPRYMEEWSPLSIPFMPHRFPLYAYPRSTAACVKRFESAIDALFKTAVSYAFFWQVDILMSFLNGFWARFERYKTAFFLR